MKFRTLGAAGPRVSALGLGCMGMSEFYGARDEGEALATIAHALDSGITLLDTADMYGPFTNELLVGRAIAGRRADAFVALPRAGAPYAMVIPMLRGLFGVTPQEALSARREKVRRRVAWHVPPAAQPRVWTHLLGTYDEVQRGGLFLFAHDKADERFPSLVTVGRAAPSPRPAKADTGTGDTGSGTNTDPTGQKGGEGSGNPPA